MVLPEPYASSLFTSQSVVLALEALSGTAANQLQRFSIQTTLGLDSPAVVQGGFPYDPRWYYGVRGDTVWIGCLGTETPLQAALQVFGSVAPVPLGNALVAPLYADVASNIVQVVLSALRGPLGRVLVSGHSYGGAVAQAVAYLLSRSGRVANVECISFGAPKVGPLPFAVAIRNLANLRWMTDDDPVPRLPPAPGDAPILYSLAPLPVAVVLASYAQGSGGVVLAQPGDVTSAPLPPLSGKSISRTIVDLAASGEGFGNLDHFLTHYVREVLLLGGVPGKLTGDEVSRVLFTASGSRRLSAEPVVVPETIRIADLLLEEDAKMSVIIPIQFRPKVVKMSSVNYDVVWMSNSIVRGQSRSNAKAFRKALYKALRVLQTEKAVGIADFQASLAAYLTGATALGSGFQPVLGVL